MEIPRFFRGNGIPRFPRKSEEFLKKRGNRFPDFGIPGTFEVVRHAKMTVFWKWWIPQHCTTGKAWKKRGRKRGKSEEIEEKSEEIKRGNGWPGKRGKSIV